MDKRELVFERLKDIKDEWVNAVIEGISPGADLIWSDAEESYNILAKSISSDAEKVALKKVVDEAITGAIHSMMVMFDGGDSLTDHFPIDIVDQDNGESLKENISLHEEFISYLLEKEDID